MFRFLWVFSFILAVGCSEIPYTGPVLTVDDVDRYLDATGEDTVCLQDGFDSVCIKVIEGPQGQRGPHGQRGPQGIQGESGPPGKDGQTLIAIHEVPVEVIVEKIIETVVVEEVIKEVPVEVVVERVVTEYVDREVPVEVFVGDTVEIIREVVVERIIEVPEKIVEIEVVKEVPVEKIVEIIKTEYIEVPVDSDPISVTEGKIYTESGYNNPPHGHHTHEFTHTHDGATHTHRIVHPNGEQDDWDREHDGFSGLAHD